MLERKHMLRETLWRQAPKGHTWVMAVYNCLLLRGLGDSEETLLTSLRAEITKAEHEGWQLVEIFRYTG